MNRFETEQEIKRLKADNLRLQRSLQDIAKELAEILIMCDIQKMLLRELQYGKVRLN